MYPTKDFPGYGSFVKNACDGLDKLGMKFSAKSLIKGKPCNRFYKLFSYIKFYISIITSFIFKRYDFIYIHFPNQAIPILRLLYKLKQPPIIINFHGEDLVYEDTGYTGKLGKLTEAFCRSYASGIVVPSEYFKSIVLDKRLIESDKIIISASGGINPKIFFHKTIGRNKKLHIGYVGRLEEEKGIPEFLNVCNLLKEEKIEFKATIIGYGSYLETAKQFIEKNNLSHAISLIEGVEQSRLGDYYRTFDLLIFCSKAKTGESLGLTGIEAMACGVPVIGSDSGGIKSYVKDDYNGWLVPLQNTEEAIIPIIRKYISLSDDKKYSLTKNCLATASYYFHENVCSNLYNNIMKLMRFPPPYV